MANAYRKMIAYFAECEEKVPEARWINFVPSLALVQRPTNLGDPPSHDATVVFHRIHVGGSLLPRHMC